ncbi:MAG: ATP-binding cassette domain-containing protein [Wenzhouxiangellaceae bacterium]
MIEVTNLYKSFGQVQAVDGVSFSARDGEVTGLLGPNGAGKTTTLRMITGLIHADRGQLTVDGINPAQNAIGARRRMGILPDARGLYRHLTARENIEYFGALQGLDASTSRRRAAELIDQLGMADIADRRTEGFSNGQRVKVAIARALVHQPQNVLLDEPTNGLDVMSIRALRQFIADQAGAGRAVVLSTHVMQEVAALCQRIVIIGHGRVVADGSAEQLLEQTGATTLEDAFVQLVGGEGMMS